MKAKVLIVDDDRGIREGLLASLQDNYEVELVEDGEKALKTLGETEVDLLLLDVRLPGMDGLEVLKRVREEKPQQSVVMMTGYATVEAAVEAMKLGAYDYLKKPLGFQEVKQVLDRALERKTLLDENRYLRDQLKETHGFQEIIGVRVEVQQLGHQVTGEAVLFLAGGALRRQCAHRRGGAGVRRRRRTVGGGSAAAAARQPRDLLADPRGRR
ncbi:response regulator, partial [candidate division TA06 bacterium]|nr:response regulator [candidate division TA06 bacterium]